MQLSSFRRTCDLAYSAAFQALFMPAWERGVRGRDTLAHLASLERSQWLSREELDRLETRTLTELLCYAGKNVPYYRELFQKERFDPRGVRSRADLAELP